MVISMPGDVLFDSGKVDLKKDGEAILRQVAEVIRGDAQLNAGYLAGSSLRTLPPLQRPFAEILRGETSLGGMLAARGFPAVPSPAMPSPGIDPYFDGGYNTSRHTLNQVVGLQIESHYAGVRDSDANRRAFAAALAVPEGAGGGGLPGHPDLAGLVAQPGFAVYRNTVMKGCVDALQANYPSIAGLVGEAWFRAAAVVHARAHPPLRPTLLDYGAGFAEFLAAFEPARELPYLPDVARLDRCWTDAHVARDEVPVAAGAHVIEIENTGKDWVEVSPYTFTGCRDPQYAQMDTYGLRTDDLALVWLHDRESNWYNDKYGEPPTPIDKTTFNLEGLVPGPYQIDWWDTRTGEIVATRQATCADGQLPIETPTFTRDIAAQARRQ